LNFTEEKRELTGLVLTSNVSSLAVSFLYPMGIESKITITAFKKEVGIK